MYLLQKKQAEIEGREVVFQHNNSIVLKNVLPKKETLEDFDAQMTEMSTHFAIVSHDNNANCRSHSKCHHIVSRIIRLSF